MVERAAPRHRSVKPEAANGGGPKGQALQTDGGEQTIELAIRQRAQRLQRRLQRSATAGPSSQRVELARPPMELRYMRDVADDRGLDWC